VNVKKCLIHAAMFAVIAASWTASGAEDVQFNRDVLPILSDKCFACHGPDGATREKDLRFDTQEGLFGTAEDGQPIVVPGDPVESELYYRITHEDVDERMPPADFQFQLNADEIEVLKRWIEQDAPWEGHWSFIPPEKPELPKVSDASWPANEIDHFILKALDDAGLSHSKEANKETLIRRASMDLTGFPPTPPEVDAFLADASPGAYEKVVDRLLASQHYGERMAFPWLDAARYSDTNGYQRDTIRTMWPWRDWVINAFNENMPFDQFTIEQLAGDLLPNATLDQKIATGFNRNHRINGEGGIIPEEYAVEYVVDRVVTTGTTWMGMTFECARCHDHKYDPVSQKEFYQMFDFFNRVPENGKGLEVGNDKPFIQVPTEEDLEYKRVTMARLDILDEELFSPDDRLDALQKELEQELVTKFNDLNWEVLSPTSFTAENGTTLEMQADGSILASGTTPDKESYSVSFVATGSVQSFKLELLMHDSLTDKGPGRGPLGNVMTTDVIVTRTPAESDEAEEIDVVDVLTDVARLGTDYEIFNAIDDDPLTGWSVGTQLVHTDREAVFVLDNNAKIQVGDTVTVTLKYESEALVGYSAGRFRLSSSASEGMRRWSSPELGPWHQIGPIMGTEDVNELIDIPFAPEEGYDPEQTYTDEVIAWTDIDTAEDGTVVSLEGGAQAVNYLHRTLSVDIPTKLNLSFGSNDAVKVWIDGQIRLHSNLGRAAAPDQHIVPVLLSPGEHEMLIKVVNFTGVTGYYFDVKSDGGEYLLDLIAKVTNASEERSDDERREFQRLFRMQDPAWATRSVEYSELKTEYDLYNSEITTTMVMEDMPTPRDTYLLIRGVYDKPDTSNKLAADMPSMFGKMDDSLPKNRLGLAEWLVNPDHPLTARVRVNHYWQQYFGQGFVKTSEDFGTQGSSPSHPDLLDYLAVDFVESGWDVKRMQKKIVMSATYRQSAKMNEEQLAKDPGNILLGRSPRYRYSAETIRDQALHISGLLNAEVGGPSVRPYQPERMWSALTFANIDKYDTNLYTPDTGDNLYRRGLYTYWKRTISPPRMQIFDAADRERCSLREDITNTPLQAMVLLNDPTFVEAARHLAVRMMHEGGDSAAKRIRYGYKLALAYEPDEVRQTILANGLQKYLRHYEDRYAEAVAFISVGFSGYDVTMNEQELAAYTMLASVILNLDETITRE
jgi:hypothetical protein